jgi:CrcB protein
MSSEQRPVALQPPIGRKLTLVTAVLSVTAAVAASLADTISPYLAVAIGSALGGVARHWCTVVSIEWLGVAFPWGTLFINVLGSFVIGFFFAIAGPDGRFEAPTNIRLLVMTGICGGYTTFSAFSLQSLSLLQNGAWFRGGSYAVASVGLCLIAVWAGYVLARALAGVFE